MGSSRKRRRHNTSAIQSPPSSPQIPLPEDETQPETQESHRSTPSGTQPPTGLSSSPMRRSYRIAATAVSSSYQYYLAPKLSDQLDKNVGSTSAARLPTNNKYYSLTDASPLYRIAIVLHPSFRDEFSSSSTGNRSG
ncbi:hypothetical protein H4Q26_016391 [Puccinia striiformis f. sp. tritici PST-130]|nr:hypothetical protein H4Q26_016391 [Puccinia striiformis f. sp. tritici PST-130]